MSVCKICAKTFILKFLECDDSDSVSGAQNNLDHDSENATFGSNSDEVCMY